MGILARYAATGSAALPDYFGRPGGGGQCGDCRGIEVSRATVQLWRKRVHEQGIGEVWQIAPGRGRKPLFDQATRERIIEATLQSKPAGMTHWSCRLMAAGAGSQQEHGEPIMAAA